MHRRTHAHNKQLTACFANDMSYRPLAMLHRTPSTEISLVKGAKSTYTVTFTNIALHTQPKPAHA